MFGGLGVVVRVFGDLEQSPDPSSRSDRAAALGGHSEVPHPAGLTVHRLAMMQRSVGNAATVQAVQRSGQEPAQDTAEEAETLRLEAVSIIEAALDLAYEADSPPDGDSEYAAASGSALFDTEQIGHLHVALANLTAMRDAPTEEVRGAALPIISAARGGPRSAPGRSVQRVPLAAAPVVVAVGPLGWVALAVAVVVVGGVIVYQASRNRSRDRAADRAEPRVRPRDDRQPPHMGNIHVQGDDIGKTVPNFVWSQATPMTRSAGLAGLAALRGMLTTRQLSYRETAFLRAAAFIASTLHSAPPPLFRTFQNPNLINDEKLSTRRVDIEIIRGQAFV